MSWILSGTKSLRAIDSSELGERFLDCVVMDRIDDEMEDDILWRVAKRAERNLSLEAGAEASSHYEPALLKAMQLTGGYVDWLRTDTQKKLQRIIYPDAMLRQCTRLGKFVAYMRARPSKTQTEDNERELAARLVSQHVRLAKCMALVLNKTTVDAETMRRTKQTALDTARGKVLDICSHIYKAGNRGSQTAAVVAVAGLPDAECKAMLTFLKAIGALELVEQKGNRLNKWRLTRSVYKLYKDVMTVREST
jgi:hypothetical protein